MKLVKFTLTDWLLALSPLLGGLAITLSILFIPAPTDEFNWALFIFGTLAWFYFSVLLAGLTILYAKHQFYVSIGYLATVVLFVLVMSWDTLLFWPASFGIGLFAYAVTIFIFKFFVTMEVQHQQIIQVSVKDLTAMLLPFIVSIGVIFFGITQAELIVQGGSLFELSVWLILVIIGTSSGLLTRLPVSVIIVAGLSVLSIAMLLDLVIPQLVWQ
ncbi:MAG: hypothetical protein ACRC6H_04815, partial [Culicoidibacterales bacterium]